MNDVIHFLDLVWPVIISATLITLQFFVRDKMFHDSRLTISIGIINYVTPISNIIVLRSVLAFMSLSILAVPAFRDYTRYFPKKYNMEVFFDNNGIKDSLMQFSKEELERLPLKADWKQDKKKYLQNIDYYVQSQIDNPSYFSFDGAYVHSKGSTSFEVKKVKGWQRYYIVESRGSLIHTFEVPGRRAEYFESEFVLLQTANNYIEGSLSEIYITFTKVIMPIYKQVIVLPVHKEPFHHTLLALTKIRVFPVIGVSRTVYFVPVDNGDFVPIGYCIYHWD